GARVRVIGNVDNKAELHAYYESADVFVLPTHHEGFPRVQYEAMIKSNVILTTFVGGIPGLMRDGYNALRLPVGHPKCIADVIAESVSDRVRMQALVTAGIDTVQDVLRHRPTHLASVLRSIYE